MSSSTPSVPGRTPLSPSFGAAKATLSAAILSHSLPEDVPSLQTLVAQQQNEITLLRSALADAKAELAKRPAGSPTVQPLKPEDLHAAHVKRLRQWFQLFDTTQDGYLDVSDLLSFHRELGEPVTRAEATEIVRTLGDPERGLDFGGFLQLWFDRVAEATAVDSTAEAFLREKRRNAYIARFKCIKARLSSPAVAAIRTETQGEEGTMDWRMYFTTMVDGAKVYLSSWHDIPLHNVHDGTMNMIVEIPRFTRKKFEIDVSLPHNPIKQDRKDGRLREHTYGSMYCNYGAFPMTWEDPAWMHPATGAPGDNDPLDVMEIGTKPWPVGSIVRVKVLGAFAMIDDGETDWKIIAINAEDPVADKLHDIEDVRVHCPGVLEMLHQWLRYYKSESGQINHIALDGQPQNREFALEIVEEAHASWRQLIKDRGEGATL